MQLHFLAKIYSAKLVRFGEFGWVWAKIKILHPQKHLNFYGYDLSESISIIARKTITPLTMTLQLIEAYQ